MSPTAIYSTSQTTHANTVTKPLQQTPHQHQDVSKLADKPLDRIWSGDAAGQIKFPGIPQFEDKLEQREWVKEHLAGAFRFWGKNGFSEGLAGHISVRDPILRDHIWMNPLGVHFNGITKSSLVLVSPEGNITEHGAQLAINRAGFLIHHSVHEARHDIESVAHCHSIHAKAWTAFGTSIDMLSQDSCMFYNNVAVYENFGGIVLAAEEGRNIAEALGPRRKTCLLQNHGSLTLGSTVDEAAYYLSALENQCRCQLLVESAGVSGLKKNIIDNEDAAFTAATLQDPDVLYVSMKTEYDQLVKETNGDFLV
ncbi:hypothetical protein QFC24_004626 [Naganishia onofrii]|uniref:Uncharacterized protein n=1 Tax=Naganishia onofrii TaxID=1851511 RepID=A0ACC2XD38_9TREE|nr:hypothetical protein QFC24_004626 [Naganishia onofrii]